MNPKRGTCHAGSRTVPMKLGAVGSSIHIAIRYDTIYLRALKN